MSWFPFVPCFILYMPKAKHTWLFYGFLAGFKRLALGYLPVLKTLLMTISMHTATSLMKGNAYKSTK